MAFIVRRAEEKSHANTEFDLVASTILRGNIVEQEFD